LATNQPSPEAMAIKKGTSRFAEGYAGQEKRKKEREF
jgi:hypothetical protein